MHWNVAPAGSELEKPNDGFLSVVAPLGPDPIDVSGAAVSTVKLRVAGDASSLPAASFAFTENV